jgi:Xaa-Pro aminopeptidase
MTRAWVAGEPDPKLREIYKIVRDAQLAAQSAVRAGVESVTVDAAARDLIHRAGYGEHFGHGLGHGVGLAVHEKPGLRKVDPVPLEENMVVTIEPGIYLPGFGGVRLENMVRVTRTGCELLSREDFFYSW